MMNYTQTCNTTCNGMISRMYRPQPSKRFNDKIKIEEKKSIDSENLETFNETIYSLKVKGKKRISGNLRELLKITGGVASNIKSKDGISRHIAKKGFIKCHKGVIYGRKYE